MTKPTTQALAATWMAGALGVLFMLLCTGASCGQSEVRTHAQIADALAGPLNQAKQLIEFRRRAEYDVAMRDAQDADDRLARIEALRRTWDPVAAAHAATVEAQLAYRDAVKQAHADRAKSIGHTFALALLAKWQALLTEAERIGVELPPIPQYLRNEVDRGK